MNLTDYFTDLEERYPGMRLELAFVADPKRGGYFEAEVVRGHIGHGVARARTQLTAVRRAVRLQYLARCSYAGIDPYSNYARGKHLKTRRQHY